MTKGKFLLIDGNALVHRAFHAIPPLTTKKGEMVNAVYGFLAILFKALREVGPEYAAATFDLAGPTFRHLEYQEYKAHRVKAPQELYDQLMRVKEAVSIFNIPIFEKEGFEADDVIGTIAEKLKKEKNLEIIILTGDLDTLQLVNSHTKIYTLKKGLSDSVMYDEKAVKDRYGLEPKQMADFKGLKGDPSDNIPGVPGIGDKTASNLLTEFKTLDNLLANLKKVKNEKLCQKLTELSDQALFSRALATINKETPIDFKIKDCLWREFSVEPARKFLTDMEFSSLVPRMMDLAGKHQPTQTINDAEESKNEILTEIEKAYNDGVFSKEVYELEKKLVPIVSKMQKNGILLDLGQIAKLDKKVSYDMAGLEKKVYALAGAEFNINSSQQLSEILFVKLGIETKGLKKTPGKVISTAAPELIKLQDSHPIIPMILEYRELAKLKNTYIDALPLLVDKKDGRIHTTFNQLGASTGRMSSQNPNLQNIPVKSDLGNEIRKAFVTDRDCYLLAADYSQLELRIVATIASDKKMTEIFNAEGDIHTATAAFVFDVAPEKVDKKMRRVAKALNFGIIYGMGSLAFAQNAGISRQSATEFIDKYFVDFAGVAEYITKIKEQAKRDSFVSTLLGRKRFIPEINSTAWNLRGMGERAAINAPVQGTAADIVKLAMVGVDKVPEAKLLIQVHDELLFEVPKKKIDELAKKIQEIMESAYKLDVPLIVDLKYGVNWGEMKPWGK